jgi:Flp pilus assembly protein TadG
MPIRPRRRIAGAEDERGQVLVLFAIVLVAILAFTALVVDIGLLRNNRQTLANAVDAGALAGGTLMPVDGSQAGAVSAVTALVNKSVGATYPGLPSSDYQITYRCLIGTGAGSNPGAFDSGDIAAFIPLDCDPRHAIGHTPPLVGDFVGAGKTRSTACRPDLGDKCNVVVVAGNVTTDYTFARVVGVDSGNTGVVQSAACRGLCGELPTAVNDVELVIDKSGSMNGSPSNGHNRIYWAQLAAKQLVTDLSANGGIGATRNRVGITTFSGTTASSAPTAWTSTAAQLATMIDAITASGTTPTKIGLQTGLADLNGHARNAVGGTVQRVLILLSDGRPNPDLGPNGLPATIAAGNMRPTQGEINAYLGSADVAYSILIGKNAPGTSYPIGKVPPPALDPNIVDPEMMKLLATPDDPSAIPPETHYFNVVDASGLPSVFHQIAGQILDSHAHLIQLYPAPIVTGVGGGATVSISGKYFTGATQVTFGGTNAAFTVNSDTSITATRPNGPSGQTVHVRVTTQGGSSPPVAGDQYTYP